MAVLSSDEIEWLKSVICEAISTPVDASREHADLILKAIDAAGFCVCKANEVVVKVRLDAAEAAAELETLAEKMRRIKDAGDVAV